MSNQPIEHHREYYIPGGDLYLQVGNVLFRAHSYFFERDSPKFRDLLWAHPEPNQVRPGSMDTDPIVIKTSSPRDFAKFLWVFYNPLYSVYEATSEEWIAILNIACEYEFTQVKDLAIRNLNLSDLSVVQRLYLYLLYRAHPIHTIPLYAILSTRDDGPSDADLKVLGVETTLSIFRIRERLLSQASGDTPLSPEDEFVLQTICSALNVDRSKINPGGLRKRKLVTDLSGLAKGGPSSSSFPRQMVRIDTNVRDAYVYEDFFSCGPGPEGGNTAGEEVEQFLGSLKLGKRK